METNCTNARVVLDNSEGKLLLCFMGEDHYDAVYRKEYISSAGFCQSLVYTCLYERVFHMDHVPEIVENMLYEKPTDLSKDKAGIVELLDDDSEEHNQNDEATDSKSLAKSWVDTKVQSQKLQLTLTPQVKRFYVSHPIMYPNGNPMKNVSESDNDMSVQPVQNTGGGWLYTGDENHNAVAPLSDLELLLCAKIAPFPYKVAKALDPNIYRNIEYDTWAEIRKEMRLCDWYYGDENFKQGTCCRIVIDDTSHQCYIQKIYKDTCDVFILNLAERRTVNTKDLMPEEDAKPWPIPYRFTKNVLTLNAEIADKYKRGRKRKDKKRSNSTCSGSQGPDEVASCNPNPYEGYPLVQQTDASAQSKSSQQSETIRPMVASMAHTTAYTEPYLAIAPTGMTVNCNTYPSAAASIFTPIYSNLHMPAQTADTSTDRPQQSEEQTNNTTSVSTAAPQYQSSNTLTVAPQQLHQDQQVTWDTSYWEHATMALTPDCQGTTANSTCQSMPTAYSVAASASTGGSNHPPPAPVATIQSPLCWAPAPLMMSSPHSPVIYAVGPPHYATDIRHPLQVMPLTPELDYSSELCYYIEDPYAQAPPEWTNAQGEYPVAPPDAMHHYSFQPAPGAMQSDAFISPMPLYNGRLPFVPQIYNAIYTTPPGTPIPYASGAASTAAIPHSPLPHVLNSGSVTAVPPPPPLAVPTDYMRVNHSHMMMQSSSPMPCAPLTPFYSPVAVDLPPLQTPTYVYPTTPSWYPPGINAQGFIFPTPAPVASNAHTTNVAPETPATSAATAPSVASVPN